MQEIIFLLSQTELSTRVTRNQIYKNILNVSSPNVSETSSLNRFDGKYVLSLYHRSNIIFITIVYSKELSYQKTSTLH